MRPCTINGNVGKAPDLRFTPNGKAVSNFSLALYGGKAEDGTSITTWVRVTTWSDLAHAVNKTIGKGDKIRVEGYLHPPRLYEKTEGGQGVSLELTAFSIKALEYAEVPIDWKETEDQPPPGESINPKDLPFDNLHPDPRD